MTDAVGRDHTCAIQQPNFFPWLGYFDKIRQADTFVFLDEVDFPRSGSGMGCWTNRVRIAVQGRPFWVGAPVSRYHGRRRIKEVKIAADPTWRRRLMRTLQMNYARAPRFHDAMSTLEPLITQGTDDLTAYNIEAIRTISRCLGLDTNFVRQSELPAEGTATELLVSLTWAVGASTYLCGGGAEGYQKDDRFEQAGLALRYQNFHPRPYGDKRRYLPGLSVIDYLMWSEAWRCPKRKC